VPEVRVIGDNGEQLGVMSIGEAIARAEEAGLDLVEVSPKAVPPVCRVMDFGKYKYEQKKKAAESRKHQSHVTVKEVKFRPNTEEHDYQFKVRNIIRFLQEGNKSKVTITFRGREITHADLGRAVADRIAKETEAVGIIESPARLEGRHMIMILAPRTGKVHSPTPAPTPPLAPPVPTGPTVTTRPSHASRSGSSGGGFSNPPRSGTR
jgi:translation initiation factor IF-3